jgi:hypothetical protein
MHACCARRLAAGGEAVASFSVRCIRSCRPFCSGCPGSIRSGTMPNFIHHTANRDKPGDRARRKRRSVVGADHARHTVLAERRFEDRLRPLRVGLGDRLATQQIAATTVRDRQRINALAIAGPKPALEIRTPAVVRFLHRRERPRVGFRLASLRPVPRQAFAIQHPADGTRGRPRSLRFLALQDPAQRSRSPARMLPSQLELGCFDLRRRLVRMPSRGSAPILPACVPFDVIALPQRIPCRTANPVRATQIRHRPIARRILRQELPSRLHHSTHFERGVSRRVREIYRGCG